MRARNIIVRHFKLPHIEQFLRISIGSELDYQALGDALYDILSVREIRPTKTLNQAAPRSDIAWS
ncbi:hypothetical protein [Azonexus sp.]|uniref:hypothetical protein n=1 Tax=Azonexus sp. TaxID=1872668 RepID=UPI0028305E06|nr:hypothetical protein [Azonexus sp.]MDR1996271.1 hypothetical protein [Azonexus sp.]